MGYGYTECTFGTGNALLRYGIDTRCAEQPPVVREAFSEAFGVKNRLFWYGRNIRCAEQAFLLRDAFSEWLMGYRRLTKRIRCYDLDNYSEKNYTFVKILYSGVRSLYDFWKADNKF